MNHVRDFKRKIHWLSLSCSPAPTCDWDWSLVNCFHFRLKFRPANTICILWMRWVRVCRWADKVTFYLVRSSGIYYQHLWNIPGVLSHVQHFAGVLFGLHSWFGPRNSRGRDETVTNRIHTLARRRQGIIPWNLWNSKCWTISLIRNPLSWWYPQTSQTSETYSSENNKMIKMGEYTIHWIPRNFEFLWSCAKNDVHSPEAATHSQLQFVKGESHRGRSTCAASAEKLSEIISPPKWWTQLKVSAFKAVCFRQHRGGTTRVRLPFRGRHRLPVNWTAGFRETIIPQTNEGKQITEFYLCPKQSMSAVKNSAARLHRLGLSRVQCPSDSGM